MLVFLLSDKFIFSVGRLINLFTEYLIILMIANIINIGDVSKNVINQLKFSNLKQRECVVNN